MAVIGEISSSSSFSSSSTHDHNRICVYDVFLSFRGSDTRNSFTDHLYNGLLDSGINTYLNDDEEIESGEALTAEMMRAIELSRVSVIVFSKNYASSTWCLDELVRILEQKRKFDQIVYPIFYDVRKQQNSFGEAMAEHKQKMEAETDAEKINQFAQKIESWKRALTEVANLGGKDANDRKETEFIKEVVTDIHRRLRVRSLRQTHLIGMDRYIESISSWVTDGSWHTANIRSVVGMGGLGKTTLANYVFGLHSANFYGSSFVEGISRRCNEQFNGLLYLQKQLYRDISEKPSLQVNDVSVYTSKIEKALSRKMVLIVLDDIGSLDQLDALLGNKGFHPGSKIIITTRDASLTERCALFNHHVQPKHKKVMLNGLYESESLELLCVHAFKSHKPEEGYEEVSEKLVMYCDGHPLALQVLGRSLSGRDVAYWEDCINVLKKEPVSLIINKSLLMSFDSLPSKNDKELFKHIACFFVGIDRYLTETILNACDINTKSGITTLIDRCLLSIKQNNKLAMHSLIQDMGRHLVRQESPDKPWKRSRLWCHKESLEVLKQNQGKGNLLGLTLDMRILESHKSLELKTDSLSRMPNLMLLQLNFGQLSGSFKFFPQKLRWLSWHGFGLKSIPLDLPMKNLVALDMSYSSIGYFDVSYSNPQPHVKRQKQLVGSCSRDKQLLASLKILDLSFCEQLHSVRGFFHLPALERLILRNCSSLIEVCESIGQCVELVHIDLSYCCKLKNLPISKRKLKKLQTLLLDGCNLCESTIKNSPDISINSQTSLSATVEAISGDLKFLSISFPRSLVTLSLANIKLCSSSFPVDFSRLPMLKELYLDRNPIVSMPSCMRSLCWLEKLSINYCDELISTKYPSRTLRELSILSFSSISPYEDFNTWPGTIIFDPDMSPLTLCGGSKLLSLWAFEIGDMVKVQLMLGVNEKVVQSLGWRNLEFIKERRLRTYVFGKSVESQTQMHYEFGIFSTIYEWKEMPDWISCRSKGPSISFTIPSFPNNLRGLNFCCMETRPYQVFEVPTIKISNITKNQTWIYRHHIERVKLGGKYCLCLLSHWMFGPIEMKAGDHITITVLDKYSLECGIGLVYEDEDVKNEEEEEDVLGYYRSWNHIIGGDLSPFQSTTGEYILDNRTFMRIIGKNIFA